MFKCATLALAILLLNVPVALSQDSTVSDFKELLSAWQGHWRGEVPDPNGDKIVVHADCKIGTDGNSLITHTYGGDLSGIWFITYDAHNKRIISQWSQSDGEVSRSNLYKDGDKWVSKGEGATGDGKKHIFVSTVTISDNGNTHVWNRKQTVDGETKSTREEWKRLYSQ